MKTSFYLPLYYIFLRPSAVRSLYENCLKEYKVIRNTQTHVYVQVETFSANETRQQ